jgi:hypothetical protein
VKEVPGALLVLMKRTLLKFKHFPGIEKAFIVL